MKILNLDASVEKEHWIGAPSLRISNYNGWNLNSIVSSGRKNPKFCVLI